MAYRANFSAASTASVPLLQKYTRSSPGALASSFSASSPGSSGVSNWTRSARLGVEQVAQGLADHRVVTAQR